MRIALATCAELPELDEDERLVMEPLRELGADPVPAVWDDPAVDWSGFDLVVVRSTWDYQYQRDAFLEWAASVPRVLNPLPVLRWNTDKRYLRDLEEAGVPIVPTVYGERGSGWTLPSEPEEVVVKPTVSAGSRDTARYRRDDPRLQEHIDRILEGGRTPMLQPYLAAIEQHGETALMYLGGEFSHAVRKGPLLRPGGAMTDQLFAPEEIVARTPSPEERVLADRMVDVVQRRFGPLAYARVDLLPGPVLLELELAEPSLFLAFGADAPARLARAVLAGG